MAIKVIAQRREVKLGKTPGMKFVMRPDLYIPIAENLVCRRWVMGFVAFFVPLQAKYRSYYGSAKKRNEFLLFCSQLFVTLQAKQERQWQNKMQYSGVQSYCWAMRRWNG